MAGGSAILAIKIIADASDAVGGLNKTGESIDGLDGKSKGLMGSLGGTGVAMLGVAGAAVGAAVVIADLTNAAAEDRAEQEKLISAYERMGISVEEATAATEAAIEAGAAKAFSDSEVRAGLNSLITATGDADEANRLLAIAFDVSAKTGVSLEQASDAVAKAHAGQDAALRKLFPGMEKQKNAADTLAEATKLSAGAADEYAASSEGMGKKGSQAFDELTETIGAVFLPIMDEVVPALLPIIQLLGELIKGLLPLLKPIIMIAVGALKILIDILMKVIGFLNDVVAAVKGVIDWIGQMVNIAQGAVKGVQDAIDAVNPFSVAPPAVAPAPVVAGFGRRSARATGPVGGGSTIVNVNVTSADPGEVMRAIRRWSRSNGGSGPFTRGLDRSTA